jgi:Tat protein translocase TatB subunit
LFGIGGSEFLIIAVIAVMLFGPDKLPKLARTIGRFMSEFKRYQAMMEATLRAEMYLSEEPADPFKKASEKLDADKADKELAAKTANEEAADEKVDPASATDDEAGASPVAEESASVIDGLTFDDQGELISAPEDAGWSPGAPGTPGVEPASEVGEEAEERL